jgi:hypothetical protein
MNANGAHPETAQGIPQTETKKVANFKDRAMGANIIVPAKTRWERSHAVCKLGLTRLKRRSNAAIRGGGRDVKFALLELLSGERTPKGRRTDDRNVTPEKITSDRLPSLPTSPSVSEELAADSGFS